MDPTPLDALLLALRECGLFTPEQGAVLDRLPPALLADPNALGEHLKAARLLNNYQSKKVRINRAVELLVGKYLILDKIGEGGMGKVYKAVDIRMHRTVALKVVRPHLMANRTVRLRYEREARAAEQLNHPNVVTLFDADEANGKYFLAMEFVNGSDLSRLVKEFGPLHPGEAAEYVRQTALGLQHAHEMGFVHRDIKPGNLLVSGERAIPGTGGRATVKILDMGLVRVLADDEDADRPELTRDGTVVGTPDYMAPEQAKNSSTVNGRADLYAIGGTLFYLLTGRPPFPDGSPIDKLLRHQLEPPPDLRKLRPDAPPELVALVHQLLAKNPDARPASAAEVADRLAAVGKGGAIRPAGPRQRPVVPDGDTLVTMAATDAARVGGSGPASGPLARRVAVPQQPVDAEVVTPVGIPRPATGASSTSIPGYDVERKDTRRDRRRTRGPGLLPFALVGVGLLALGGVFAYQLWPGGSGTAAGSPGKPPSATGKGPEGERPVPPPPPPPPRAAALVPPGWNLPESAAGVLVAHPKRYWEAVRAGGLVREDARFAGLLNRLAGDYRFDLRTADRLTVAFPPGTARDPNAKAVVAIAEGGFLTADWVEATRRAKGATPVQDGGQKLLAFAGGNGPAVYAGFVGGAGAEHGYALSGDRPALAAAVRRSLAKKDPGGVPRGVLEPLPHPADPDPPLFTFAAGDHWVLPGTGGRSLHAFGVQLAVARVRLADGHLNGELLVYGDSREALRLFLSNEVQFQLAQKFEPLKPLVTPFAEPEYEPSGNLVRLRTTARWELADVQEWIDRLLPAGDE